MEDGGIILNKNIPAIGIIFLFLVSAVSPMVFGYEYGLMEKDLFDNYEKRVTVFGNSPEEEWNRTFGGINRDHGLSVKQNSDGGFIITGNTYSFGAGSCNLWLIKTNLDGNEEWNKTFGGNGYEEGNSVLQTTDGGYVITGVVTSYGAIREDLWLIKTDSNGNEQWNKTFGGIGDDWGFSVQQTNDGGFIITGTFNDGLIVGSDIWLIKTDESGVEQWNETFGGEEHEWGFSVQQTTDEGFIITGFTCSYGAGVKNLWLIKTNASGKEQWNKTFGGASLDEGFSVQQTSDGGYIITGETWSYGEGLSDVWLIKTDINGNEQWNKTYGESSWDYGKSVQQTKSGGYIIAGTTFSGVGPPNIWLIKTDYKGTIEWTKIFGGDWNDYSKSVQQTIDHGYIVIGSTRSYGAGKEDIWLIKVAFDENQNPITPIIDGPPSGKVGVEYEYNFLISDPDSDSMFLRVDWGIVGPGKWHGPFPSGTMVKLNYSWYKTGIFTIRAQAMDTFGAQSEWGTLEVSMPKNKVSTNSLLSQFLERFLLLERLLYLIK